MFNAFKSIRAEWKLTNAKKYLQKQAAELTFQQRVHGVDNEARVISTMQASTICHQLSWNV